ncbi:hypothetical protein [Butyrivibrio sp. INlla16]|uniref:hypothetical protein n=1 Tax=Butyrivibrio sp. INlla16 TaxID=1520807 RepID=UPI00088368C5|nr:hypothetical protein [Butyrivibrio sp. INlla16]SDB31350.1 hypothetical protein SAMN02910263_01517 [Butyrivibrio sp. INlla16]
MVYQSSAQKAEDNQSSGIMLITVGAIGLIGDVFFLVKNPLDMPMFNKYLTCGVMGALFVLFFVMGILAVRSYKIFKGKAAEEDTVLEKIKAWSEAELTSDYIDTHMYDDDEEYEQLTDKESLFFKRSEFIKKEIMKKYVNVSEELVDSFIDNYYDKLYGDEN